MKLTVKSITGETYLHPSIAKSILWGLLGLLIAGFIVWTIMTNMSSKIVEGVASMCGAIGGIMVFSWVCESATKGYLVRRGEKPDDSSNGKD